MGKKESERERERGDVEDELFRAKRDGVGGCVIGPALASSQSYLL